jgi:preprotein translocase subunit SecD
MRGVWNAVVLLALVLALGVTGWYFTAKDPIQNRMKLGLDLKGGVHMVLQGVDSDLGQVNDTSMEAALKVVENRVNAMGLSEPLIQREGTNRIIVELAGETDTEKARATLGTMAVLQFMDPNNQVVLDGKDIEKAGVVTNNGAYEVSLKLKGEGPKKFADATAKFIGQQIAIKLDDKVISAPTVQAVINDGSAVITGNFKLDDAKNLADLINGGALPVKMEIKENRVVSATLGADSLHKSAYAGVIGLAGVFLFMLVFYGIPGLLADIALLVYIVLTMGVLLALNSTFTLPGMAGILLSIGMAVDGNIIIFERCKEELRNGKALRSGIDAGFHRAFAAIFDGQITTAIAAGVLYFLGAGTIKGFAITLFVGVLLSIFTSVTFSRWLLKLAVNTGWFNKTSLFWVKEGTN